jgi:hypothetical protein
LLFRAKNVGPCAERELRWQNANYWPATTRIGCCVPLNQRRLFVLAAAKKIDVAIDAVDQGAPRSRRHHRIASNNRTSPPNARGAYEGVGVSKPIRELSMSIRVVALAMVLNSAVSIAAWESWRPVPARAQTEACDEQLSEPQDQVSKCLSEAIRLLKERDCWEM